MRVTRPRVRLVAADGERQTSARSQPRLPAVRLGILLFIGVMIGGQTLMTSTVEEKSSRVIEVLLSAVSPLELMAGKLLGQMGVSLRAHGVYTSALGMLLLCVVRDARPARSAADLYLVHLLPASSTWLSAR